MIGMGYVRLDDRELSAVHRVLRSGKLRAGEVTADFEARFARAVGAKYAVAVSSGTAALHVACLAMLAPGDEVVVPDFTFAATASMVLAAGAKPVLADVDPRTFTLDPADVRRRISTRTRALIPVHLYGNPADIAGLRRVAHDHKLRIIWDAAQAHGAAFRARDVGAFPDVVCYSFYPSKNMTTGEGGMLTTSDKGLAEQFRLLRSHGDTGRYHHVRLGYNYRLTDIGAAIGRVQLGKLPGALRRRRRNAAYLSRGLRDITGIELPLLTRGVEHAFSLFTVRLRPEVLCMTREAFRQKLAQAGIDTAVHYPIPLHRQPIFQGYGSDLDFPVSTALSQTVLSLPVHPGLTTQDLSKIVKAVRETVATVR